MLNAPETPKQSKAHRNRLREQKLWHDGRKNTPSLGCTACPDQKTCGGMNVELPNYHCLDYCCGRPNDCDSVCRNKPREFAQRVREIGGFQLHNVPRSAQLPLPPLPSVVPVLFHGNSREARFAAPAICLPLYSVIARHRGEERYEDEEAIAAAFRFAAGTPLILTGTADDRPIERWWSLGSGRQEAIRRLRDLGIKLVTTPNFSLFTDQPRWDDMYSMKRIAITHEEFLREGLPAALHVNARTERDWERWTEFILLRSEVMHVAFEFKTGGGWARRVGWQAAQLVKLAHDVGRSLHLVVRAAGPDILSNLTTAFRQTTVLDTTSFMKAVHRQRAIETANGRVEWKTSLTTANAPLDELLSHNWTLVRQSYDPFFGAGPVVRAAE